MILRLNLFHTDGLCRVALIHVGIILNTLHTSELWGKFVGLMEM